MSDWLPPPKDRYAQYPWERVLEEAAAEEGPLEAAGGDGGLSVVILVFVIGGVVLVTGLCGLLLMIFPE